MEQVGLETLEDEVAEKKRRQVFDAVAKACSVGAQMTLIMGGGALLFRWDGHASLTIGPRQPSRKRLRKTMASVKLMYTPLFVSRKLLR